MKTGELKTYSFTEEDINLITFSLRQLAKETGFKTIKEDSENLIGYIERLKQDHLDEKVNKAFEK